MNKFLKEQGDYVLTWNSLQGVHKKWSTFPTVTSKPAFVNKGIYVNKYVTIFASLCMRKGRRQWHPTPVLLPGKSHGRRSLVGCSPWDLEEWDTTEWLDFHFSLSCFGEGNGNPLQCYCLENPRDGGAWWAAVYGVAQSWTRLKWLSSSRVVITFAFLLPFIVKLLKECF